MPRAKKSRKSKKAAADDDRERTPAQAVSDTLSKMKGTNHELEPTLRAARTLADLASSDADAAAKLADTGIARLIGAMRHFAAESELQETACWALSSAAQIEKSSAELGLASRSKHLGVVTLSLTDANPSAARNRTDAVLAGIAKVDGIATLVNALRDGTPAGTRMTTLPTPGMMECGITMLAGLSGLDMPGPREPEPRKWQISRAGGIEPLVKSMMARPGDEAIQHRALQTLRNLHTQVTDWAHKFRSEVQEVGVVQAVLMALDMHPGSAAVQANGLFVLVVLASNQGSNLEHNIHLGRSLISAPTASAREDLDTTRGNVADSGGVAAATRAMRAHPDDATVQLAASWLMECMLRYHMDINDPRKWTPFYMWNDNPHAEAIIDDAGDLLMAEAMLAHPGTPKLQQLGCSMISQLAQGNLLFPHLRILAPMPHRPGPAGILLGIPSWIASKMPWSADRPRAARARSVEAVVAAITNTTGDTDKPCEQNAPLMFLWFWMGSGADLPVQGLSTSTAHEAIAMPRTARRTATRRTSTRRGCARRRWLTWCTETTPSVGLC